MGNELKISPTFGSFLAESGPNDKQDALVVFRAPTASFPPVRGRLRQLKNRLDAIEEQARAIQPAQTTLFEGYERASSKRLPAGQHLAATPVGGGSLPVATIEVTRKTLSALAAQPEVVAIMPNQQIHLIRPSAVRYEELAKQEQQEKLTWGLQQLQIPDVWSTTKGQYINVAVLDTGVYGENPALHGRVRDFMVMDPLGRRIKAEPTFDSDQHGTHVCGTIAGGRTPSGVAIGVAPEAQLLVAAVLIGHATLRTLLEGITWAVERGADIINMSLGFSYYEPLFGEVFDLLIGQYGVLPVVAIGNTYHGNSDSPGSAHSAFSVGAVRRRG
jgi:subtilisin family serine protease